MPMIAQEWKGEKCKPHIARKLLKVARVRGRRAVSSASTSVQIEPSGGAVLQCETIVGLIGEQAALHSCGGKEFAVYFLDIDHQFALSGYQISPLFIARFVLAFEAPVSIEAEDDMGLRLRALRTVSVFQ